MATVMQTPDEFDFNQFVKQNKLDEIKDLLIKHKMVTTVALSTTSNEFRNLMCDAQTMTKSHFIAKIFEAINKLQLKIQQIKPIVVISEKENNVIKGMKESLKILQSLETEINDIKQKYPKSVSTIRSAKNQAIENVKKKVVESISVIEQRLQAKKVEIIDQLDALKSDVDSSTSDIINDSVNILQTEKTFVNQKLGFCTNLIQKSKCEESLDKTRQNIIIKIGNESTQRFENASNILKENINNANISINKNNSEIPTINFVLNQSKYDNIFDGINNIGYIVQKKSFYSNDSTTNEQWAQKSITEWTNDDVIEWINAINLPKNVRETMVNEMKECKSNGEDIVALKSLDEFGHAFRIANNAHLCQQMFTEINKIKPDEVKDENDSKEKLNPGAFQINMFSHNKTFSLNEMVTKDFTIQRIKQLYKLESGVNAKLDEIQFYSKGKLLSPNNTLSQIGIIDEKHLISIKFAADGGNDTVQSIETKQKDVIEKDIGKKVWYHPQGIEKYHTTGKKISGHPGYFKGGHTREYSCCGGSAGSKGCKMVYACCGSNNSVGCQKRYICCKQSYRKSNGCKWKIQKNDVDAMYHPEGVENYHPYENYGQNRHSGSYNNGKFSCCGKTNRSSGICKVIYPCCNSTDRTGCKQRYSCCYKSYPESKGCESR